MCNKEVKFGAFHAFAKAQGADVIATGHYAQTRKGRLLRGIDPEKDQSYFLWAVPPAALADAVFPLGGMHKADVRALALKFRLPNARKRDSQGICFLGSVSVEDFLAKEFKSTPGDAFDAEGKRLGAHAGALLYTLGQRAHLEDAPQGPWYVIAKDMARNSLTVAHEPAADARAAFALAEMNWFASPEAGKTYQAQYRYHGPSVEGTLDAACAAFIPSQPLPEAVAPGQSLAIYDGEECIGGGIIA